MHAENTSAKANAWNELRGEVVREAVVTRLVQAAASEVRQRLVATAKEAALKK